MEDQIQTNSVSSKGTLKICHISDLHNRHTKVAVPECDLLICSGDISGMGYRSEVEPFFKWFKRQHLATYKILVAGNHDISFDASRNGGQKPEWLQELIDDFTGEPMNEGKYQWSKHFYLENESCLINGIKIWGSPQSSWFNGETWVFNARRGKESNDLYSTIPLGTDIVITHGPPFGHNDWCRDVRTAIGCEDLRYHIQRVKPLLCLSGHIHESYGYDFDNDTYYFNGAICDLSYNPVNKPWLLEADFDAREVKVLN